MKAMKKVGLAAALLLLASALSSQAVITGSKHDFSAKTWSTNKYGQSQICLPCHAPHNNLSTNSLLWNHASSVATYQLYSSWALQATAITDLSATSKRCMGCHDGTVALDSFGGKTGSTTLGVGDAGYFGTDLRNDHPVSIVYDAALIAADGGLHALTDPVVMAGGTTGTVSSLLIQTKVECGSCHDVHNEYNQPGMLNVNNTASKLCLSCHAK